MRNQIEILKIIQTETRILDKCQKSNMQLSEIFFLIALALKLSGTKNKTWNNEKSEVKNQKSEKNLEL